MWSDAAARAATTFHHGGEQLSNTRFHLCGCFALAGLLAPVWMAGGCGNIVPGDPSSRTLFVVECQGLDKPVSADLVLLDWGGGVSQLYPADSFAGLDFASFDLVEGGTLAAYVAEFKADVEAQVNFVFCQSGGPFVHVQDASDAFVSGVTKVLVTQSVSPASEKQIGEGAFDPCNNNHNDDAIVFGERIRDLYLGMNTYNDWVMIFANVIAHEIGHTLGYGHVVRREHDTSERLIFLELMLDGHTLDELRGELRFVVDQSNCPAFSSLLRTRSPVDSFTCGVLE